MEKISRSFSVGHEVYYTPQRKRRGLRPPIERAVVLGFGPSGVKIELNHGLIKWVKIETLAPMPETLAAP